MSHKLYKRVPVDPPATGHKSVESGTETVDLYVTVDLETIARSLGSKAMVNKSRQSKYLDGAVIVEARNNAAGVFALFEQAIANRLKYPKIRLQTETGQPVCLARAGDKSKYTGQVMITDGEPFGFNKYFGRIDERGVFHTTAVATGSVINLVGRLGADPVTVASEYGRLTGNCCFCGLKLTDARSTAVGYGPVCAEKFGLAWGE